MCETTFYKLRTMKMQQSQLTHSDEEQVIYFTSDSLAFLDEQSAKRHARTLEDKDVKNMTASQVALQTDQLLSGSCEQEQEDYWLESMFSQ